MRIFMCDICGDPFKQVRGSINNIKFYEASYNICSKCFEVIRETLIDLRNAGAGDPPSDSQE